MNVYIHIYAYQELCKLTFCFLGSQTTVIYLSASLAKVDDKAAPMKKSPSIKYPRKGGLFSSKIYRYKYNKHSLNQINIQLYVE